MSFGTIVLYPTLVGMDLQNRALEQGIALPKITRVTASNGVPPADLAAATALTGDVHMEAAQVAVERLSQSALRFEAGFPNAGEINITQIGVWLADGTLLAIGPLPTPFFKGEGVGVAQPGVLSRSALEHLQLDINILDVNALSAQIVAMAMAQFTGQAAPVVTDMITPLEQAVRLTWQAGAQRFEMELWGKRFSLRDIDPLNITGARAGDDSMDLADAAGTVLGGDYILFDAANREQVRLEDNLELGRRTMTAPLAHTYPGTAILARTDWTINPGEAIAPAGGVYFPRRLRLTDGDVHSVYIYALTAPGAPVVSWRTPDGEFVEALLTEQRVTAGEWSEYHYEVPAGEYFNLRVETPAATRVRAIVACNTLRGVRVVTPPTVIGDAARPGEPVALALTASSRLVGGEIARFDVVSAGMLTHYPATADAAVATLTLTGEAGEYRRLVVTAVDDLGNRSAPVMHRIELRDDAAPAAPVILTPAANATGISLTPTLTITAPVIAGETHGQTDWQIRASNGVDVMWQALASAQLTSMTVSEALPANTELQVWVRGRGSLGTETAWGSRGFVTAAAVRGVEIGIVLVQTEIAGGVWQRVDGDFNPINTNPVFFNTHPVYSKITEQRIDEQYMVRLPKFWIKTGIVPTGEYTGKRYWMISDQPTSGFELHPAFDHADSQLENIWVGKYQATAYGLGDKLGSMPDLQPKTNETIAGFKMLAHARNVNGVSGFQIINIHVIDAIRVLMMIEVGSTDMQTAVGRGYVDGVMPDPVYVSDPVVAQASWRGIVGLWGNMEQVVDGLKTDQNGFYHVWDSNRQWQPTNIHGEPGYIETVHMIDGHGKYGFYPKKTQLYTLNTTFADWCLVQGATWNDEAIAMIGGSAGSGSFAGLFAIRTNYSNVSIGTTIGTRIMKV